jgi:tRNA (guanine37-N1)-methyltransferase
VFLSPQGETLTQKTAERLVERKRLVLVCGHYEGIDERAMAWVDQELSIGDFVMTGGELPAMVVTETVARLVPGVVGDPESLERDSFSSGMLDHPHYTRPARWRGKDVPAVLLSGDHAKIEKWRRQEAARQTERKRPDLLKKKQI